MSMRPGAHNRMKTTDIARLGSPTERPGEEIATVPAPSGRRQLPRKLSPRKGSPVVPQALLGRGNKHDARDQMMLSEMVTIPRYARKGKGGGLAHRHTGTVQ